MYICYNETRKTYLKHNRAGWTYAMLEKDATQCQLPSHFDWPLENFVNIGGEWKIFKLVKDSAGTVIGREQYVSDEVKPVEKEEPTLVKKTLNTAINKTALKGIKPAPIRDQWKMSEDCRNILSAVGELRKRVDPERIKNLQREESKLDKQIVDITHYIEWANVNACEGYKLFAIQQSILRRRRDVKNELRCIQMIMDNKINSIVSGSIEKKIEKLEHEHYSPRDINEMFCEAKRK